MKITKTKILFLLLTTFVLTNSGVAQKVAGYSFDKYPATIYKGPKAKVNLKSSATAKSYRTTIKEQYQTSKIDFGGKYSLVTWGAGMGLTLGAMVDNATGNVYDLPLTEENSVSGSCQILEDDNKLYNKNSNLFITYTWSCEENKTAKTNAVTKYYSIFLWDDAKKKFTLLKSKTETKTEKLPTE